MVYYPALLRKQYAPRGVFAGASHFKDVWTRDALFASFGSIAVGDISHARDTVQFFLKHSRDDGLIPLRIGAKDQLLNYCGFGFRSGPVYAQDKGGNPAVDPNLLILILADRVERAEGNTGKRFNRAALRNVVDWTLANLDSHHLIRQGPYADWEDSIKTTGNRLYTSVCLVESLRSASRVLADASLERRALAAERAITTWWNGSYFTDGPLNKRMMTAGNLLAIVWGIATREQARAILKRLARRTTTCPPAGHFVPTVKDVYAPFFLVGLADYHASMEWSWLAALEIHAYEKAGMKDEATRRRAAFDALVTRHKGVYEVYLRDKPVRRTVYRSERDFAWAIGLRLAKRL
jgi:glycogen debranching enzyme